MAVYTIPERQVPLVDSFDVIVVGGGPAGVASALAAARHGAKVLLLEQTYALGGMSTNGRVPTWCPFSDREKIIYRGIAEEIFEASNSVLEVEKVSRYNWVQIDPEGLKRVYDELLHAAGVTVHFGTFFCGAEAENGVIKAIFTASKAGVRACSARVFIDATGDGDLAFNAGCETVEGDGEGHIQAASLCFALSGVDEAAFKTHSLHGSHPDSPIHEIVASRRFEGITDTHICSAIIAKNTVGFNAGHLWNVHVTDVDRLSESMREGRAKAKDYLDALREYDAPTFRNAAISATADLPGIREARRVIGDYVLTTEDYLARRSFPDEIGRNCYYLDIHLTPEERAAGKHQSHRYAPGESHGIPYRCLTPLGFSNLLVAGRCISTDRAVYGSTRVMPVCLVTGQAAGTAAALCLAEKTVDVHAVDVPKLRQVLREDGAYFE